MTGIIRWIAVVLAFSPGSASAQSAGIVGRWATQGFGSIVEMQPCRDQRQSVCGRIRWLWEMNDAQGQERIDIKNPDRSFRGRPIIGIEIMRGFRETAPGIWTGGSIYNPDDGRTYTGTIRLRQGMLVLKGCAFGIVCQTQNWRRPEEILAAVR